MHWSKNTEIELSITSLTSEGLGIGKSDGFPFFVKGAVPGDVIRAGVTRVKKTYGYARLIEILTPSEDRVTPPCPEAHRCGGCQLMHMSYEAQRRFKEQKVADALTRIAGIDLTGCTESHTDGYTDSCTGSYTGDGSAVQCSSAQRTVLCVTESSPTEPTSRYRNKVQVPFGTDRDGNMIYGFYAGRTHNIIPMKDCIVGFPEAAEILATIRNYCEIHNIPAYNETTGEGVLRHVLLRKAFATGEIQVCLVVNKTFAVDDSAKLTPDLPLEGKVAPKVTDEVDDTENRSSVSPSLASRLAPHGVTSLCINYNPARTNVILGPHTQTIYGNPYIEDILCGLKFRIAAPSFYQVNPAVTEKLYETVVRHAIDATPNNTRADTGDGSAVSGIIDTENRSSVSALSSVPTVIWDLYCGIGTISLALARALTDAFANIYGVEIVPEAIENAHENARINGITNATFFVGRAEDIRIDENLTLGTGPDVSFSGEGAVEEIVLPRPNVIVIDPPRKGCDAALIDTILRAAPERIVYVSCDPATLARDLKRLTTDDAYLLVTYQTFDMFPNTHHVETVVLMSRVEGK